MVTIDKDQAQATVAAECLNEGGCPDALAAHIAACAYFKAEKRGFAPGYEMEDWYAAEKEILDSLALASRSFGMGLRDS